MTVKTSKTSDSFEGPAFKDEKRTTKPSELWSTSLRNKCKNTEHKMQDRWKSVTGFPAKSVPTYCIAVLGKA
jgi:hypothetical protein